MIRKLIVPLLFSACAAVGSAQVAEISVSGGVSRFGNTALIDNPPITLGSGFRLAFRFTLNTYRFFGHEIGYGYAHTNVDLTAAGSGKVGMPVHSGFYDFLAYALPEGSRIRPFACGGVQFSSFVPPGASVYYGNQVTKFGFNYGGGIKFKLKDAWGIRIDVRQYNSGKPDLFQTPQGPSGRLKQTEISAGVSFNL
jgi:opacity protein-like surface antigen